MKENFYEQQPGNDQSSEKEIKKTDREINIEFLKEVIPTQQFEKIMDSLKMLDSVSDLLSKKAQKEEEKYNINLGVKRISVIDYSYYNADYYKNEDDFDPKEDTGFKGMTEEQNRHIEEVMSNIDDSQWYKFCSNYHLSSITRNMRMLQDAQRKNDKLSQLSLKASISFEIGKTYLDGLFASIKHSPDITSQKFSDFLETAKNKISEILNKKEE